MVLVVLLATMVGWMATPGDADDAGEQLRDLGGVGVRQEERADDLLFVLRALLGRVRGDDDRALVQHLVEELIGHHDLLERLLQRHALEVERDGPILEVAIEGDVDAGRTADEIQDVANAGVGEADAERIAAAPGSGSARPTGGAPARAASRSPAAAPRPPADRGASARARRPRARPAGSRARTPAPCGIPAAPLRAGLAASNSRARLDVHLRGRQHRALERDLVVRPIRIVLQRLPVKADGGVPVAGLGGLLPARVRAAGGAGRERRRQHRHRHRPDCQPQNHAGTFLIAAFRVSFAGSLPGQAGSSAGHVRRDTPSRSTPCRSSGSGIGRR